MKPLTALLILLGGVALAGGRRKEKTSPSRSSAVEIEPIIIDKNGDVRMWRARPANQGSRNTRDAASPVPPAPLVVPPLPPLDGPISPEEQDAIAEARARAAREAAQRAEQREAEIREAAAAAAKAAKPKKKLPFVSPFASYKLLAPLNKFKGSLDIGDIVSLMKDAPVETFTVRVFGRQGDGEYEGMIEGPPLSDSGAKGKRIAFTQEHILSLKTRG